MTTPGKTYKLKNPQTGEENLLFRIANYNPETRRCIITPVNPPGGLNPNLPPQELVAVTELSGADHAYLEHEAALKDTIQRLINKLNNDQPLTQGQYNTIRGMLERKQKALKEGRVY